MSIFAPMNQEKLHQEVNQALNVIREGGVIIYPTETTWTLGCDAENESAVRKLDKILGGEEAIPYTVLIHEERLLHKYSEQFPEVCYDLLDVSVEPLTIIYPNGQSLASGVVAKDGSVAMRVTNHPFCHKLISQFKKGIVSTSANRSGQQHDGSFTSIPQNLLDEVDYVVDFDRDKKGCKPTSIIKIGAKGEVEVLRS